MSNTFELIIQYFPVALVPEIIILFLAGDDSIDNLPMKLFDDLFTCYKSKHVDDVDERYEENNTYLDEDLTILHSFNGKPAQKSRYITSYFKNGKCHRDYLYPALENQLIGIGIGEWNTNGVCTLSVYYNWPYSRRRGQRTRRMLKYQKK